MYLLYWISFGIGPLQMFLLSYFVIVCVYLQLLDISELDMVGAGREAKRRRKTVGKFRKNNPMMWFLSLTVNLT